MRVTPQDIQGVEPGLLLYRNRDHVFLREVERSQPQRQIAVRLRLESSTQGLILQAEDEDGIIAMGTYGGELEPAQKPKQAESTALRQLTRTGDTPFRCEKLELAWERPYYLPTRTLNALRRETLDRLLAARQAHRPLLRGGVEPNDAPFPQAALDYRGNVLNQRAAAFYRRHGVDQIEPAAESGLDMRDRVVMRTRYCLQHQLGLCDGQDRTRRLPGPLYLVDEQGHRYPLEFDCARCEMKVLY